MVNSNNHCDVAIVGASFAWLSAYLMLRKRLGKKVNIKLFDMRDKFTYTPWLHECLGDQQRLDSLQFCLRKYYGECFVHEKVHHIHDHHELCTESACNRTFDYAVIATGSRPQFFNNESRMKNGFTLRRPEDIARLNAALPVSEHIAIIGGGITGVETASVIKQRFPEKKVHLVHSRDIVLHTMWSHIQQTAHAYLEKQGIQLHYGTRLQEVEKDHIILQDGTHIPSTLTIITAWVTADDSPSRPYLTFENTYTALESENIYVAGDVATHGLLPTAHNAFFEWRRAGDRIADKIQGIDKEYPPLYNRTNLAIALWTKDGIMTFGEKGWYLPRYTSFAKWIVEKRVLFEFKRRIPLPI